MPLRALILSATLKPSPAASNTEALARVVIEALEGHGVECELVRLVDHDVKPGVSSDEDGAHHVIAEVSQCLIDIGFTFPGQAWTYWNKGPRRLAL
jgi:multimeric flavodoxin WrbA